MVDKRIGKLSLLVLSILLSGSFSVIAQADTARAGASKAFARDTAVQVDTVKKHSPKKALLYSAILPGAGQVYNRKYWKVGVLAAGAGGLIYSAKFNQRKYQSFKSELIRRQQSLGNLDPELDRYSDANLIELQNFYRRYKELSLIGIGLLYFLNLVDATVDAHLMDFDISDDLSLRVRPEPVFISAASFPFPGLGLTLNF